MPGANGRQDVVPAGDRRRQLDDLESRGQNAVDEPMRGLRSADTQDRQDARSAQAPLQGWDRGAQPFTAPIVSPETSWRWKNPTISAVGIRTIVDVAASWAMSSVWKPIAW